MQIQDKYPLLPKISLYKKDYRLILIFFQVGYCDIYMYIICRICMIYLCLFIHMAIELEIVYEISFQGKASLRLIEIASHGKFISALVLLSGISKASIHVNTFTVEI